MLIIGGIDIGNRLDIGQRMISAIQESDLVLVESYQYFSKLCSDLGILASGQVLEYYSPMPENEEQNVIRIALSYLNSDRSVLICPDDGMAGIADPGGRLVSIAHSEGHEVSVIPGPSIISALPAALAMGGKSFIFDDDIPGGSVGQVEASLAWVKQSKKPYLFLVKNRRDHNAFLKDILGSIARVFGENYPIGVGINITMPTQIILRGGVSEISSKITDAMTKQDKFISVLIEGMYE